MVHGHQPEGSESWTSMLAGGGSSVSSGSGASPSAPVFLSRGSGAGSTTSAPSMTTPSSPAGSRRHVGVSARFLPGRRDSASHLRTTLASAARESTSSAADHQHAPAAAATTASTARRRSHGAYRGAPFAVAADAADHAPRQRTRARRSTRCSTRCGCSTTRRRSSPTRASAARTWWTIAARCSTPRRRSWRRSSGDSSRALQRGASLVRRVARAACPLAAIQPQLNRGPTATQPRPGRARAGPAQAHAGPEGDRVRGGTAARRPPHAAARTHWRRCHTLCSGCVCSSSSSGGWRRQ